MIAKKDKPIKYIGYFDFQDSPVARNYVLSAANKMEYIAQALVDAGYRVEIISHSAVIEPEFGFFKAETKRRGEKFSVKFFSSFGGSGAIGHLLRKLWHTLALLCYLIFKTRKDEPVIVYHSLGYYNVILIARWLRRFRIVLELEEIYQDVSHYSFWSRKWEYNIIRVAESYILSTDMLNVKINTCNKPYIVIYGTYRVGPVLSARRDDGKIHVVYAGTLDPQKGGADAVAAARYLPGNYHIHILGFGSRADIDRMEKLVEEVSAESKASVSYDGLLRGDDYTRFIQSCHIGLCTQTPDAKFNATSFPSKILSYLSNGLRVVSIEIEAIRSSAIGRHMTYYKQQTPQNIARAIERVDFSTGDDSRAIVAELDTEFVNNIDRVLP